MIIILSSFTYAIHDLSLKVKTGTSSTEFNKCWLKNQLFNLISIRYLQVSKFCKRYKKAYKNLVSLERLETHCIVYLFSGIMKNFVLQVTFEVYTYRIVRLIQLNIMTFSQCMTRRIHAHTENQWHCLHWSNTENACSQIYRDISKKLFCL